MKSFIVLALFVAAAVAAPAGPDAAAEIVEQASDNIGVDGFSYKYKTSNGIEASESGQLKSIAPDEVGIAVTGEYSYIGDDGVVYRVIYIADEKGFQPQGAHLPQAP